MTYNEMVAEIKLYTEEANVTWVASIDNYIDQAELAISREIRSPANRKDVDLAITTKTGDTAASTHINSIDNVRVVKTSELATGPETLMKRRDTSFIYSRYSLASETGRPKHYAISGPASAAGELTFLVGPTPSESYTLRIVFYGNFDDLVSAGGTNETWLSKTAPDAILFGALYFGYVAMKGELGLLNEYKEKFNMEIAKLKHMTEHDLMNDMSGSGAVVR